MTDKEIAQIYREMEIEIIDSMKRNLNLHISEEAETGLDYPQWQAIKLRELRKYQQQNRDIIQRKLGKLPREVEKQLREELEQGYEGEIEKFITTIGLDKYYEAVMMNESFFKLNTRKVDSLIEEVNGSIFEANHAALRMANDVYRDVIFKTGLYVANGVKTEQQAYDMAVKEFLERGLGCIEYKDGRRVNIADYVSMAVRTANQRAYMMGEGEFRKEIGNPLVIISRHNTSCELCAPFQNKVLIDDVYSGGTQDDGDYMLMSEAMNKGLFHPRCRHGLGTYYPEIDEINREYDDYVERDVTDYGEHSKAHIENMIQRYKRLSHGCTDPDNIAKYEAKLDTWEDKLTSFDVAKSENGGIIKSRSDDMLIYKSSAASPLYISEKDDLYNNAKKVEPIDGYEDVVIHSDKKSFYAYNMQGDEFPFTAEEMAKMIKQSKGYHGGNIRLIACESASEGATIAQQLADELGVDILAPSDIVWIDPDGKMTIGQVPDADTGRWVKIKSKRK